MKTKCILFAFLGTFMFLSCDNDRDEDYAEYLIARPMLMDKSEFATSVTIIAPRPIEESGKVYTYGDYIFINDKYQGVHVIDNSNPRQPVRTGFIKIPGNVDISVKDDRLYADSLMDLVVLDISDMNNIKMIDRLENVLQSYVAFPVGAVVEDPLSYDMQNEILVGWTTTKERRLIAEMEPWTGGGIVFDNAAMESSGGGTGQGGSMARFIIVGDHLYAVDSHNINIFGISDLDNPQDMGDVFAGFDIETIFNQGDRLFLGSMRGMYIYDISTPGSPTFVSEFQHGTACDPVVVDGDYAYVTLRGGNGCGATESGLFIVDISVIEKPELAVSYPMDGPYGLGIKDEKLFVCDGESGLKVYDKTDIHALKELDHFEDIVTFDVIPMEQHLIMVGDGVLYQYEYLEDGIKLLSQIGLD
jgi:hypothetical protein